MTMTFVMTIILPVDMMPVTMSHTVLSKVMLTTMFMAVMNTFLAMNVAVIVFVTVMMIGVC